VVRTEGSRPRGCGFESRRILDGCKQFASYYIKRKIENKGSQMGHTKKIFLKKFEQSQAVCYNQISLFPKARGTQTFLYCNRFKMFLIFCHTRILQTAMILW
jgi:hypothetical protein